MYVYTKMTNHVSVSMTNLDSNNASPLTETSFIENFDEDKCRILLTEHKELLQMTWSDTAWGERNPFENEYEQVYAYYNSRNKRGKHPSVKVDYKHCKDYNYGRVYPVGSLSLGSLRKEVRHTLCGDYYYDFDIANAHPVILYQIAKSEAEAGWVYENIEYYVKNREDCLKQVMEAHPKITRDDAKTLFIILSYGGSEKRWWSDRYEGDLPKLPQFVKSFKDELKILAELICGRLPELHDKMKKMKKMNPKNSALSVFLQDKERCILETMLSFFIDNKYLKKQRNGMINAVLCFDGIMIPKSVIEQGQIDYILDSLALYVKNKTGFQLTFTQKAMDKAIDVSGFPESNHKTVLRKYVEYKNYRELLEKVERFKSEGVDIDTEKTALLQSVSNPLQAARKLLSVYSHFITTTSNTSSTLWVYNDKTMMWSNNPSTINSVILDKAEHYLNVPLKMIENRASGINNNVSYAFSPRKRKEMLENLMAETVDNTKLKEIECSSLGKLLFKNGYLDGNMFYPLEQSKPNPDLAFFTRVEANLTFPQTDEDRQEMEMLKHKLFYAPLGEELGDYLITFLARALMGHTDMKLFPFLVGFSNTGKTTLYKLIKRAFNGVVGDFNIDCIVYNKNGGGDPAQKQRWALLNRYMRLMFASESGADTVDSRMYKTLSSAGDGLTARQHCGNEETFYPHFTCVGLTNQMVSFAPADDAVSNRCRAVFYKRAFVPAEEVVNEEYHIARDEEFEKYMETEKCIEVLRWVIVDAFITYLEKGKMVFPASAEDNDFVSSSKVNDIDVFLEDFEITGDCSKEGDYISQKEFNEWYKVSGLKGSKSTFYEAIKRHAIINGLMIEKARNSSTRIIKGVKFRTSQEEDQD